MRLQLESDLSIEVKRFSVNEINELCVQKRMIETAIGPEDANVKTSTRYILQIEEIRDKMIKHGLDDRIIYLLCGVAFHEAKKRIPEGFKTRFDTVRL